MEIRKGKKIAEFAGGAVRLFSLPSEAQEAADRLLSCQEVQSVVGLSRPTIYRLERASKFPKRLRTSANRVAWRESDVREWMASRPQKVRGGN